MERTTYYFSHDGNAAQDPKMQALLATYGMEGYGRYWRLVEMLFNQKEYKLMRTQYVRNAVAYAWLCDVDTAAEFLDFLVNGCELIRQDDDFIWSDSLLKRMEFYEKKSISRSKAGRKAAQARWENAENTTSQPNEDANVMRSHTERNATAMRIDTKEKEKEKGKEKDITSTNVDVDGSDPSPHPASPIEFEIPTNKSNELFPVTTDDIQGWLQLYPAVDVRQEIRKMIGWSDSNPVKRKTKVGMKRFITNWLARQQDSGGTKGYAPASKSSGVKLAPAPEDYAVVDPSEDVYARIFGGKNT